MSFKPVVFWIIRELLICIIYDFQSEPRFFRNIHVAVFDNTLRKSDEGLRNRARRYAHWAPLSSEAGISIPADDDEWCVKNKSMLMHRKGFGPLPGAFAGLVIPGT